MTTDEMTIDMRIDTRWMDGSMAMGTIVQLHGPSPEDHGSGGAMDHGMVGSGPRRCVYTG